MIDIVYPLGSGSKHNDLELRYSLRSVQQHLLNVRNVIVIGERPEWLTNVVHIKMHDEYGYNRDKNIYTKIYVACKDNSITDNFVFFNDDHFMLLDMPADGIPYYHREDLATNIEQRPASCRYRISLNNSYQFLRRNNYPTWHYDIHTPIIYNRRSFIENLSRVDWDIAYGYVIKSLYANMNRIPGEFLNDCKIDSPRSEEQILHLINGRPCFSLGDNGLNDDMRKVLNDLYPIRSDYELFDL